MANKTKRAIEDSKRKKEFKVRQKGRNERHNKKNTYENNKYVQRGSGASSKPIHKKDKFINKKRQQKKDESEEESEVDSEEEYNRVMAEEDPELERDLLGDDAAIEDQEDIQMEGDNDEFADEGGDLDLPDEDEEEV